MESIKNTMRYLQLGIKANPTHNYSLRKWQRVLWYATLYVWRTLLFFGLIYLLSKLIY
jgi:hypothetical protein